MIVKETQVIKLTLIPFALIVCLVSNAFGQALNSSMSVGARNVALGNADMAEPHDIGSLYGNPATIAMLGSPTVLVNHVQGSDSQLQEDVAFPVIYTKSQMLAFGAEYYSVGVLTGSPDQRRVSLGYNVAFASKINRTMSLGGLVLFQRGYVAHLNAAASASYALGFDYKPSPDLSYGLTLSGLGTGVDFATANSIVTPIQTVLSRALTVSAVMRFPTEASFRPAFMTIALASQKVFSVSGVNYMGGVEFYPTNFLTLRFGYNAGPAGARQAYGIGLSRGVLALDMAISSVSSGNSKTLLDQLSLSVKF